MATDPGFAKIFSLWVCFYHCGCLRYVQAKKIVSPQGKNSSKKKYPY